MSKESKEAALAAINANEKLDSVSKLILEAIEDYPALEKTLQSHGSDIRDAKRIVHLIHEQKGLQTNGVIAGLRKMESLGTDLKVDLLDIDERALEHDVQSLINERKGLTTQIRSAFIGLKMSDGVIILDVRLIHSTNMAVQKALGVGLGLVIANFMSELKRKPDEKGRIQLTEKDYEKLVRKQTQFAHPEVQNVSPGTKTRILCNCMARGQSIQILGPVGKDLWWDIALIKTENMFATDNAIQFGYAVTTEVFMESLDRQERRTMGGRRD